MINQNIVSIMLEENIGTLRRFNPAMLDNDADFLITIVAGQSIRKLLCIIIPKTTMEHFTTTFTKETILT